MTLRKMSKVHYNRRTEISDPSVIVNYFMTRDIFFYDSRTEDSVILSSRCRTSVTFKQVTKTTEKWRA